MVFNINQIRAEVTSYLGSHLPKNKMGLPLSLYLVCAEGHSEPSEGRDGGELEVLLNVLVQVGQVETLVEAAVLIGNDIKQKAAVLFIGIDMMKDHHWICVKLGGHRLPSPSVDNMNVSLKEDAHLGVSSPSTGSVQWHRVWDKYQHCHVLARDPGVSLPPSNPLCSTSRVPAMQRH